MTDLNRALVDIRSIRRQVAQTSEFHGYGPLTLSATAGFALLAGALQAHWLPDPASHPGQYVGLWLTTAIVSAALIATQMLTRANRLHSGMADEMIQLAVLQFLPAGVAGAVVPCCSCGCRTPPSGCSPASGRSSSALVSSRHAAAYLASCTWSADGFC